MSNTTTPKKPKRPKRKNRKSSPSPPPHLNPQPQNPTSNFTKLHFKNRSPNFWRRIMQKHLTQHLPTKTWNPANAGNKRRYRLVIEGDGDAEPDDGGEYVDSEREDSDEPEGGRRAKKRRKTSSGVRAMAAKDSRPTTGSGQKQTQKKNSSAEAEPKAEAETAAKQLGKED